MGLKILHSADWHMGSAFASFPEPQRSRLRQQHRSVPDRIARLCREEGCDLMLLAGDIFDGPVGREITEPVKAALAGCGVPVFVAPGNHDFCGRGSPWLEEIWPENVTVFTQGLQSVAMSELDCRIWGAGYRSMDCPGLLEGFRGEGEERFQIGVLHADPVTSASPCCPVTHRQIRDSGLAYLALGHIHKSGLLRCGDTLCGWPGCPMGRGWDETGDKGVCIVTLGQTVQVEQRRLDLPGFRELEGSPEALLRQLPAASEDYFRLTVTGWGEGPLPELTAGLPNAEVLDRRLPEEALWGDAGEDTLMGVYFGALKQQAETDPSALLAARLSRAILEGREVVL